MLNNALQTMSLSAHLGCQFARLVPSYGGQAKLASLPEEKGERWGAQEQTLDGEVGISLQKQLLKSRAYLLSCELREADLAFGRAHVARPTGQSQPAPAVMRSL